MPKQKNPEAHFPNTLSVVVENEGTENEYLFAAKTDEELAPSTTEDKKPYAVYELKRVGTIFSTIEVTTDPV